MELTLAVFDPEASLSWPVRISGRTGSPGALVGEILSERLDRNASWYIGDLPLDGTSLGTAPLVDGAVVRARPLTEDVDHMARLSIACAEGFGAGFRSRIGRGVHAVGRDDVDIRLENPHLPPCAAFLSVSGESVTLRPVGRLSGIRLLPGHRLGLHGSSLVIEDAQGHPTHAASRSPIPAHEVRLFAPSQGWAVMLATSLMPIAFGAVAAWLWGMWFMLLFGAMSALVSGAHWLTRGGGAARNRRRLHDARVRELDVLAQAIPPVGLRLADAVARIEGTLPARSNGMTDTASSPLSGDELWIRWGRGTRHLHISPNSPQTGPQVKDMPLVTSLSLPHVLVMSDGVRTDGLPVLIGHALAEHLVLEWVGCAGDCRICTEFLRRWGRLCVPASGRLGTHEPRPPDDVRASRGSCRRGRAEARRLEGLCRCGQGPGPRRPGLARHGDRADATGTPAGTSWQCGRTVSGPRERVRCRVPCPGRPGFEGPRTTRSGTPFEWVGWWRYRLPHVIA